MHKQRSKKSKNPSEYSKASGHNYLPYKPVNDWRDFWLGFVIGEFIMIILYLLTTRGSRAARRVAVDPLVGIIASGF